ncbi:MAG TPA: NAD-dependent epimerase/dehydratase family protein [Mycobacteriales bacterium]|nr:NAD-dependent epimerase/dehydratase family protein [Mycobacteriales bacterium]
MHVLVTGGTGMLGGHLVRRLAERGDRVRAVDLRQPASPQPGTEYLVGDVRDGDLMARAAAGVDAVVHCAAALPSYPDAEIRSVIVGGTRTVLGACQRAGVGHVVHISSTAVYGLPDRVPTTEDAPIAPVDTYSTAKAAAEEVCQRYRADGQLLTVLRPKTFVGPGRLGLFSMLFEWADDGHHFPVLGRGDVRIQMLAIDDLLDGVLLALAAAPAAAGGTYNLGATEFGTLREDFQAVLDAAGHGKRVIRLPAAPALAVLRLLGRTGLSPVYGRLLSKLTADSYVSVERARDQLGFTPRYSNQDAVLRTFAWWRAERTAGRLAGPGRTSRDAWRQGALGWAKALF